jgi:hypothetical protein
VAYIKFRCTPTPSGLDTAARVFTGPSFEDSRYSGTLVLPTAFFEELLDCLITGAAQLRRGASDLEVYFGPDEDGEP